MTKPPRRVLALAAALLLLTSCRLDATVTLVMAEDGTGTVTITATADVDVVDEVPDLADELELADATAAGWEVTGPDATAEGGMTITLSHEFRDAAEATALLSSIGGPFATIVVTRRVEGAGVQASASNTVGGSLVLQRGFAGFADQQLIDAVGGTPFAEQLASVTPETTMSVRLDADLPGTVTTSNGERNDGVMRWEVPLDGTELEVELATVQAAPERNGWAGPVSLVALVALVAWVAVSVSFIGYVAIARRRRVASRR